ncbi:hypothetical protein O1M63_39420 [Streptomyces mirabilis]|nr:hypothetical protein [Streptomyces mirabilis]
MTAQPNEDTPPDPPSPRVEFAELLEAELVRRWPGRSVGLDAVHRYAMIPPGKLLRPSLVLHAALAVGGELGAVLPAAVGVEGRTSAASCTTTSSTVTPGGAAARPSTRVRTRPGRRRGQRPVLLLVRGASECRRLGCPPTVSNAPWPCRPRPGWRSAGAPSTNWRCAATWNWAWARTWRWPGRRPPCCWRPPAAWRHSRRR